MKVLNLLLVALVYTGVLQAQEASPSLLQNGDFSALNAVETPKRWFTGKTAVREESGGGHCMKIGPNAPKGSLLRSAAMALQPQPADAKLTVRCKIKTSGVDTASSGPHYSLMFRLFDGAPDQVGNSTGKLVSQSRVEIKTEQPDFVEQQLVVTVPEQAVCADFCVMAGGDGVKETLWIRDVSVTWR